MQNPRQDIRFAISLAPAQPGFTVTAILVIALATGAKHRGFQFGLLRGLSAVAVPEPFRLVSVTQFYPVFNQSVVSSPTYLDWSEGSSNLAHLAAYSVGDYTLTTGGIADRIAVGLVTHDFFDVLGDRPIQDGISQQRGPAWRGRCRTHKRGFFERAPALGGDRGLSRRLELDGKSLRSNRK